VNTEITEYTRGWVFYDATCGLCVRWAERCRSLLLRRGFHLVPLQAAWVAPRLGLTPAELLYEMKLLTADGEIIGGADCFIHISRYIWWARPFFVLAQIPGVKPLLRAAYRWVARNRHCLGNQCPLPPAAPTKPHHRATSFYELP